MSTSANNAVMWRATTTASKFREVAQTTENPSTKLLVEGLTHLAEAIRELDRTPPASPTV